MFPWNKGKKIGKRANSTKAALRKAWARPGEKERRSAILKRAWARPGEKERRGKIIKRTWNKPGAKEKFSKAFKKAWSRPGEKDRRTKLRYHYEKSQRKSLEQQGWKVFSGGWPDFICVKKSRIRVIEAKAPGARLEKAQEEIHRLLKILGVTVEII